MFVKEAAMKITVSVIKADIGSVGGHIAPSAKLIETVKKHVQEKGKGFLIDNYVSFTGDDIAILMTHGLGERNEQVHKLAWDAFVAGTAAAKAQGLYGAGQDLLKDAFSGNVHGMGPAVTEMEFDERPGEPYMFLAADKTDPGAFNFPLYLAFADAMNTPGLMLSPELAKGFKSDSSYLPMPVYIGYPDLCKYVIFNHKRARFVTSSNGHLSK